MQRRAVQGAFLGNLDNLAQVHHRDAVADVLHHRQVVRDKKIAQLQVALQVLQQVDGLCLHRYIQRGYGFVADDKPRLGRNRPRNPQALSLSAGKLVRIKLRLGRRQADRLEQFPSALLHRRATACALDVERLEDDVLGAHARIERCMRILEDDLHRAPGGAQLRWRQRRQVDAVELDAASRGLYEPQQQFGHGGLAAAGLAHQAQGLALADGERHAIHGTHFAHLARQQQALLDRVVLGQAVHHQQRWRHARGQGLSGACCHTPSPSAGWSQ